MARISATEAGNQNVVAFLDMLAYSELGYLLKTGPSDDGYNIIVSGKTFDDYSHHPNVLVPLPRLGISSTAAGRYQFIIGTWRNVQQKLHLPDFSPLSQDKAAIELIRGRGALDEVKAGRFAEAVNLCRKEWASLPGAGYNQPEHNLASLQKAYEAAGGEVA